MKREIYSIRLSKEQSELAKELSVYFNAGQSDVCGAALTMIYENRELMDFKSAYSKSDREKLKQVCRGNVYKYFDICLSAGRSKSKLEIYKQNNSVVIPKGTKIGFIPPFTIDFEVSSKAVISLDISPEIHMDIFDELNGDYLVNPDEDILELLEDNRYSIKIIL